MSSRSLIASNLRLLDVDTHRILIGEGAEDELEPALLLLGPAKNSLMRAAI